ncbi:hypothetical protein B0T22DRAFT_438093 [Podospora appendiculata]|uniref:Uncharacterized protein n=1 Tax=Podospora appendiculata TaxID=314037 RepID=A0AAE0XKW9_9PEZI|nr:hypothetical protein B0T22DRAFT_438093 [Podospora appendiculata]
MPRLKFGDAFCTGLVPALRNLMEARVMATSRPFGILPPKCEGQTQASHQIDKRRDALDRQADTTAQQHQIGLLRISAQSGLSWRKLSRHHRVIVMASVAKGPSPWCKHRLSWAIFHELARPFNGLNKVGTQRASDDQKRKRRCLCGDGARAIHQVGFTALAQSESEAVPGYPEAEPVPSNHDGPEARNRCPSVVCRPALDLGNEEKMAALRYPSSGITDWERIVQENKRPFIDTVVEINVFHSTDPMKDMDVLLEALTKATQPIMVRNAISKHNIWFRSLGRLTNDLCFDNALDRITRETASCNRAVGAHYGFQAGYLPSSGRLGDGHVRVSVSVIECCTSVRNRVHEWKWRLQTERTQDPEDPVLGLPWRHRGETRPSCHGSRQNGQDWSFCGL